MNYTEMDKTVYLDNAATTFPKPNNVIYKTNQCIKRYCANPGRSSHRMAIETGEKVYEARERISDFIGFDKPENIVFCPNATFGLNLVIKGILNHKCHAIISDLEHNSVIRPLNSCTEKYGCIFDLFNSDLPEYQSISPLLKNSTELMVTTLASNVTGASPKYNEISEISRKNKIKLLFDGSQLLGHKRFNIKETPCDYLVCAGHKSLFGIQGVAFIVFNNETVLNTIIEGGSGFDTLNPNMPLILPERYEAGTLPTPAIVSLSEGIKFINDVTIECIENKLLQLTEKCKDILNSFENIKVFGGNNGIVSFNFGSMPSSVVSDLLSRENIATRSGLHCAPFVHKKLDTLQNGAVRVSFSFFNSQSDLDKLFVALKRINMINN